MFILDRTQLLFCIVSFFPFWWRIYNAGSQVFKWFWCGFEKFFFIVLPKTNWFVCLIWMRVIVFYVSNKCQFVLDGFIYFKNGWSGCLVWILLLWKMDCEWRLMSRVFRWRDWWGERQWSFFMVLSSGPPSTFAHFYWAVRSKYLPKIQWTSEPKAPKSLKWLKDWLWYTLRPLDTLALLITCSDYQKTTYRH